MVNMFSARQPASPLGRNWAYGAGLALVGACCGSNPR